MTLLIIPSPQWTTCEERKEAAYVMTTDLDEDSEILGILPLFPQQSVLSPNNALSWLFLFWGSGLAEGHQPRKWLHSHCAHVTLLNK